MSIHLGNYYAFVTKLLHKEGGRTPEGEQFQIDAQDLA